MIISAPCSALRSPSSAIPHLPHVPADVSSSTPWFRPSRAHPNREGRKRLNPYPVVSHRLSAGRMEMQRMTGACLNDLRVSPSRPAREAWAGPPPVTTSWATSAADAARHRGTASLVRAGDAPATQDERVSDRPCRSRLRQLRSTRFDATGGRRTVVKRIEGYTWMGTGLMCDRCGCLVMSAPVHDAWHEALEQLPRDPGSPA